MKGLNAGILESKEIGNCSAGGLSSRCKSVTIIGEGIDEIFEATADSPAVKIVKRGDYIHAEPVNKPINGNIGWMAGGTFIYSCDSRFPAHYPIPLHDRQETQANYDILSA